jgi:hypothetical protein
MRKGPREAPSDSTYARAKLYAVAGSAFGLSLFLFG